ncbi:MAG: Flp pilus assembly complex ATPase component TadA [Aliidiomarina sp.]|uniref:GspE/PulE family protein n=1 Tax=Aliidiomarina sp. TaxID=1872439 RepID=UPI0025BD27EF|nr:ATPase, T2SS/T4P/T4SS family [Aliidiomarina sp.]MCH8501301.1 Flp pilus assembly complex ATPase component TadA [Aliidiomarina sp.]
MNQLPSALASFITEHALNQCTDLHLEATTQGYRWRARRLGQLILVQHVTLHEGKRALAAMKAAAALDITERHLPQDGRFQFSAITTSTVEENHRSPIQIDCRLNTVNTLHGEKLVLRLQVLAVGTLPLSQLGLSEPQLDSVQQAIQAEHGLILVTGATGSGKTRTLYAMLEAMDSAQLNIVTVEDPVEIALHGVNQVPVSNAQSLTFARALRALLRQDPDVIMIGEIRDTETAQIACQAAQTGHLVLATLHASNPLSAFIRLQQLGVDYFQLAACLLLLTNQQLVVHQQSRRGVFHLMSRHDDLIDILLAHEQDHFWPRLAQLCQPDTGRTQHG